LPPSCWGQFDFFREKPEEQEDASLRESSSCFMRNGAAVKEFTLLRRYFINSGL